MAAFFHCLTSPGGPSRFWPFADKSGIRAAEDRTQVATYRRSPITSIRRFSSAVEQRFCKPKVGSSILSTGTSIYNDLALNSPAFSPHSELRTEGIHGVQLVFLRLPASVLGLRAVFPGGSLCFDGACCEPRAPASWMQDHLAHRLAASEHFQGLGGLH